jgi:predicted TIM-barrel fold metal-dependent hydrolase
MTAFQAGEEASLKECKVHIIDSHTHVDEFEAFGWFDPPEAIIELMDEAGIEKAVVMTYADAPVLKADALQYIHDACKKYPDRLIPYARINPHADNAAALLEEAIVDLKMKGLKIHQESVTAAAHHDSIIRLVKRAAEFDAPILFHSGDEALSLPQQFTKLAEAVPEATIILAHMGGYHHTDDAIGVCEKYENLLVDTSACPYPDKIKEAIERLGADRVLFGSDGPGCNPKLELQKIKRIWLSEKEERMVLHDNIASILERVRHTTTRRRRTTSGNGSH